MTGNALVVEHGFLSRRTASISLNGTVFEVERTLLGRILGYGTVVAGELEIDYVPRRLTRLLAAAAISVPYPNVCSAG